MAAREKLKNVHKEAGWRLLGNEKGGSGKEEKIALIGVQNWGAKAGFPKYGNLAKAHKGTENHPFKILLSHDPSHWDHEVTEKYKDIDPTLSGHTHGFQFGIEIPGFKWGARRNTFTHTGQVCIKTVSNIYM